MKNISFIIILILFSVHSLSQGLIINASNFYLTANSNLILSGTAKWVNNGTVTCASGSNIKFTGSGNQFIKGSNATTFSNVYTLKSNANDKVFLLNDAFINGTLYLQTGNWDLTNKICDLGTTGNVSGENENARIRATNSNETSEGSEGSGTGIIRALRNNPSGNVAGLGLNFTPSSPLGNNTIIIRGCNALQGTGSYTGNWSIFRWYRINPGSVTYTPITVNNFYYWGGVNNYELNGHTEANLQMFQQVQYWNGSTNPIYWEPRTTTTNPASDFVSSTTTNNPIMLNYILITLGSTTQPLPVEYLTFNGYCKDGKNVIFWQTASERNNLGFTVQKSSEAIQWQYLTFVEGNGNTNTISNYEIEDLEPHYPITYYRLIQTDFDGKSQTSSIISVQCYKQTYNEDFTTILNDGHLIIDIQGIPQNNYNLIITNVLGQIISNKNIVLNDVKQQIVVEKLLAAGIYHVSLVSKNNFISKPVFVN